MGLYKFCCTFHRDKELKGGGDNLREAINSINTVRVHVYIRDVEHVHIFKELNRDRQTDKTIAAKQGLTQFRFRYSEKSLTCSLAHGK